MAAQRRFSERVSGPMSLQETFSASQQDPAVVRSGAGSRYLFGPVVDFLCLGGLSFVLLPALLLLPIDAKPAVALVALLLANLVNHPHFAHSYQIFYRDYFNKLMGNGYAAHLRWRYAVAGLVVPVLVVAGLAAGYLSGNKQALGASASAMAFFVGWHYVKQGYGILIVDSVMKRGFFSPGEKKVFKANAYACWIFFFLLSNHAIADKNYFGLKYYVIDFPVWLIALSGGVMLITTFIAAWHGARAAKRTGRDAIPLTGYVAYITSIYVWLCTLFTPAVYYMIPAFHSLQYLAVVWKYEYNRGRAKIEATRPRPSADTLWVRYGMFIGLGVLLGLLFFYLIPVYLDLTLGLDDLGNGYRPFAFMSFIFINIHHYFLDNVMWRKDNPDVSNHLFGRKAG